MSTAFKPLEIPPGVVAKATKKQGSTNYSETNLVRWMEGRLQPVGGQGAYTYAFASRCRRVHSWYSLDQIQHTAYLCEQHLYVDTGGALLDITPTGGITPAALPNLGGYGDGLYGQGGQIKAAQAFTTSTTVISMAAANPGWVVPGMDVAFADKDDTHHVGKVQTYTGVTLTLVAAAALASRSASDMLNFGAYNESRAISSDQVLDKLTNCYSLANFGAYLVAMVASDTRLLVWDPASAPGTLAKEAVAASGKGVVPRGRCFVVTSDRFVQVFGAFDVPNGGGFRRMAWCEQEDFTNWSYADTTTQAGFIDIEPAAPIVCATATRTGTIFWTAKKCLRSRYLGQPYIYNYEELSDNCTPWSPQSATTTSSMLVWMSQQGAFAYDGTSVLPIQCAIRPWIDADIDILNVREQAFLTHVENFNEVWWFFPQDGQPFNTRCGIFNYRDGWWGQGRMSRSAGITASYTSHTVMADGLVAYEHESGVAYGGAPEPPWVETYDLNIASGARLATVKQLIPDVEGAAGGVRYSLFYRNSRAILVDQLGNVISPERQTLPKAIRSDGYVDLRTTGRDIRLRIDLATATSGVFPVTLGQHLIDVAVRGDR